MKIETKTKVSSHHLRAYMIRKFEGTDLARITGGLTERPHSYPLIQYKMLEGQPLILGLNEGADALKEVAGEIDKLYLGHHNYDVLSIKESEQQTEIGVTMRKGRYSFLTPWLALNDQDYSSFKYLYDAERSAVLSKMIVRNLIGFSRMFKCEIKDRIRARHQLKEITPFKLGTTTPGFVGEFDVNYTLPDYVGIGNMSERGFGTLAKSTVMPKSSKPRGSDYGVYNR